MSDIRAPKFFDKIIGPKYRITYNIPQSLRNLQKFSVDIHTKNGICPGFLEAQISDFNRFPFRVHYLLTLHNERVGASFWEVFSKKSPMMFTNIEIDPKWRGLGLAKVLWNMCLRHALDLQINLKGLCTNPTLGYHDSLPDRLFPLFASFGMTPDQAALRNSITLLKRFDPKTTEIRVMRTIGELEIPFLDVVCQGPGSFRVFLKGKGRTYETDENIFTALQRRPEEIARLIENDRAYTGVPYVLSDRYVDNITNYALSLPSFYKAPTIPFRM